MSLRLLSPTDYVDMPWKNGGGTTCELFRLPHPHRPAEFALRLSIASVAQGGPFSAFIGVDRSLMLLEGAGMALCFDGAEPRVLDQALQPIQFAGEIPVDCQLLAGPLRDFNLMVARDWGAARLMVQRLSEGEALALAAGELTLVYLVSGELQLAAQTLQPQQLLQLETEPATLLAKADAVLIHIEAQAHPAL